MSSLKSFFPTEVGQEGNIKADSGASAQRPVDAEY